MPYAILDGLKINYLVQGSGPPLIMSAPGEIGRASCRERV